MELSKVTSANLHSVLNTLLFPSSGRLIYHNVKQDIIQIYKEQLKLYFPIDFPTPEQYFVYISAYRNFLNCSTLNSILLNQKLFLKDWYEKIINPSLCVLFGGTIYLNDEKKLSVLGLELVEGALEINEFQISSLNNTIPFVTI